MSDVFISYARTDGAAFAERLAGDLSQAGYSVWWDRRNLDPNQDFTAELEGAIKRAEQVVVCVTSDTTRAASYVRREIGYAEALKKPIVPLMVDGTLPPISIVNVTRVDFAQQTWKLAFADLRARLAVIDAGYTQSSDSFHGYLTAVYRRIVDFLDKTMMSRIDLRVAPSQGGDESADGGSSDMLSQLFMEHGVREDGPLTASFDNFGDAFAHYAGRVALLGQPGSGKTTTLLTFARDAVAARLADAGRPLPLLGTISSWDPDRHPPLGEWFLAGYKQLSAADLQAVLSQGTALLLLDGLDELGRERVDLESGQKYDPRQRFMSIVPDNNHVVVTCRTADYETMARPPALNGTVALRTLDDEQLRAYLRVAPELWNAVSADESLREMVRTPLLLSLFAFAFSELAPGLGQPLNLRKGDLRDLIFEKYVRRRYEHEARKPQHAPSSSVDQIYEALGRLTFVYAGASAMGFRKYWPSPAEFTSNDVKRVVRGQDAEAFTELVTRLHLLMADGETLRFRHLLLRDHCAYRCMTQLVASTSSAVREGAVVVLGGLGDSRAVPLLTAALSDQNATVRWYAADALEKLADPGAVAPLIRALADAGLRRSTDAYDQTPPVYWVAAEALVAIGSPAVAVLVESLTSETQEVRGRVVEVLGSIRDPAATGALKSVLSRDALSETTVIGWTAEAIPVLAANALERIGTADALVAATQWWTAKLSDFTQVPSGGVTQPVCALAASALERFGTPATVKTVVRWWIDQLDNVGTAWLHTDRHTVAHVRFCDAAAAALLRIGTPQALRAIHARKPKRARRAR